MAEKSKRHLLWAGVGALLARGLPLAARSVSWNFTALFGRVTGGLMAVLMLGAFMVMLFLISAGKKRVLLFACTAALYASGSALIGFVTRPMSATSCIMLTADWIIIAASLWMLLIFDPARPVKAQKWAAGGVAGALCLVLPAGLYWGSRYCPGTPSAAMTGLRMGAACSLLAAGGLVCAAWAHADIHESRFSWKGLLTGILTIMLIDIAI